MVKIVTGQVMHFRLRPVRHGFTYPVFYLRVPLDELATLPRLGVALDRFGLVSLVRRDFGPRDGSDLEAWVRAVLQSRGVQEADGTIVLQAFPRILDYAFNPIAVFLAHDRAGRLRAALCEVRNTFGERHHYVVRHADGRPIDPRDVLVATKAFHVSPFCEVAGHYRFRFGDRLGFSRLAIDYHDDRGPLIATALHGREAPLTKRAMARALSTYPFMTLAVTARIHWQALRLWMKRVPWHRKPAPPEESLT